MRSDADLAGPRGPPRFATHESKTMKKKLYEGMDDGASLMGEPLPEPTWMARLWTRLGGLPGLRDLAVVGVAGLYVLGYTAWSVHAWRGGLGLLPAADLQYVVGGLLILVAAIPALLVIPVMAGLAQLLEPRITTRRAALVVEWTIALAMLSPLVLASVLERSAMCRSGCGAAIYLLAYLVFYSSTILAVQLAPVTRRRRGKPELNPGAIGRTAAKATQISVVASLLLLFLPIMLISAYPAVPQALGGAAPRCAQLDIAGDQVSPETLAALSSNTTQAGGNGIARTGPVWVYYQSADEIMVRPTDASARHDPVYGISRGAVQSVVWCG